MMKLQVKSDKKTAKPQRQLMKEKKKAEVTSIDELMKYVFELEKRVAKLEKKK